LRFRRMVVPILALIDPGVKINGTHFRDVLLSQHLSPVIRNLAPEGCFAFRQYSAPAHRAKETIKMLTRDTLDFISSTLWPPNSPDLNPVDYKAWSVMQDRVYQPTIHDINDLKRLLEVWDDLDNRRRCCPMHGASASRLVCKHE
jgi:hypothetical protein